MTVSTSGSSSVAMNRASGRKRRADSSRVRERCAAKTREAPNTFESSRIMQPMGPRPMTQMLFPSEKRASSRPFTRAGERLGEGRLGEREARRDRGDGTVLQRGLVQEHVLLEPAGELVADRVVDPAVGPHAVRAPAAGAARHVGTEGDPVALCEAGDLRPDRDHFAGDLVADHRGRLHPIIPVMEDPHVRPADRAGHHLQDGFVLAASGLGALLDFHLIERGQDRSFHGSIISSIPILSQAISSKNDQKRAPSS